MPRPPRLPGITLRSRSWLRRRNSSRSGGRDPPPDGCGPDPQGPRDPEPHGPPPPLWLLHGIKSLLAPALPALQVFRWVIGEGSARYNAPSRRGFGAASRDCQQSSTGANGKILGPCATESLIA